MNNILILAIAASICTAVAGILHLSMVPSFNTNSTILFLVGCILQIFWVVPTLRNWGKVWDYVGIAGTAVSVMIWGITRMSDNPITGRAGRVGETAIIEVLEIAFICPFGNSVCQKKRKDYKNDIMTKQANQ